MNSLRATRLLISLPLAIAAFGCSHALDDLPREPVAGTVTMDGLPLTEAVIQFSSSGQGSATGANGPIKDGQFSIPREDGPVAGSYKVSISHADLKDVKAKGKVNTSIPQRTRKIGPEQIPARYNSKTELKAEVKVGGVQDLKFELLSK